MSSKTDPAGLPPREHSPAAAEEPAARAPLAALAALVALAVVVRAIGLDNGLWIDEVYALARSFRASAATIVTGFWGDTHHPLYSLLAHFSITLFGESPWTMRLPALLFGVAAIPVLYGFARVVVDRREALLASLVIALSYHHIWFSQNARGYTAIATLTLAGAVCLLRGLTPPGRTRWWMGFSLASGLAAYAHLTAVFIVLGHLLASALFLWSVHASWPRWRVLLAGAAGAATVTLALYAPMATEVVQFFLHRPSPLRGVSTPGWAFLELLRSLSHSLGGGVLFLGALVSLLGLGLGLAGLVSITRRNVHASLLIVLPVVTTLLGALLARGTFYPRFLFFMILPAALVLVRGVFAVVGGGSRDVRAVVVVVLFALGAASGVPTNWRLPKQDFAGAMQYVLATRAPGDQVASAGLPDPPYNLLWDQPWPVVSTRKDLDSLRTRGRTWLLFTFPHLLRNAAPEVAAVLSRECPDPLRFRGSVGNGDIRVCLLEAR